MLTDDSSGELEGHSLSDLADLVRDHLANRQWMWARRHVEGERPGWAPWSPTHAAPRPLERDRWRPWYFVAPTTVTGDSELDLCDCTHDVDASASSA